MWKWYIYIYIYIYQPQPRGLQRLQLAELGLSEVCSPSDGPGRNPGWRRLAPYASARSWWRALNTWPSCALPVTRAFLWNMLAEVSEQGKSCYVFFGGQLKMDRCIFRCEMLRHSWWRVVSWNTCFTLFPYIVHGYVFSTIPVVLHKAVAEVSKIGNL